MKADEGEAGEPSLARWQSFGTLAKSLAISCEHSRQAEIRSAGGKVIEDDRHNVPLRETLPKMAQVCLETTNHHRVELARANGHAACEALWVEDFE